MSSVATNDNNKRNRLLAHTLVEALWDQLLLDVSGGGGVFTLGDTSRLIGTTVAAVVSLTAVDWQFAEEEHSTKNEGDAVQERCGKL